MIATAIGRFIAGVIFTAVFILICSMALSFLFWDVSPMISTVGLRCDALMLFGGGMIAVCTPR